MRADSSSVSIDDDVAQALADGSPVVALESTIISHGMPSPENVETALAVENTVRERGATPATIAVIDGKLRIGIGESGIWRLGEPGAAINKVSRRDLAAVISRKQDGATTVAATMIGAALAGIPIFATGGIGGVHRDFNETMDVSADLEELARTSVAVVCAGAKSILDLPRTLQYLETKGVPVVGYRTQRLPAFYTADSGLDVDVRADSAADVAQLMRSKWSLGLDGGIVVANPIPAADALDSDLIDRAIDAALEDMRHRGVSGKDATPFLLARVAEVTGGDSLRANVALVRHNAGVAADIAVEYARLTAERR